MTDKQQELAEALVLVACALALIISYALKF